VTTIGQMTGVDAVDEPGVASIGGEGFAEFYVAHRPELLRFVRRRCWLARVPPSRVDPEDVVQEVFADAFASWSTIEKPVQWTYVVARRRVGERAEAVRRVVDGDPAEVADRQVLFLDEDGRGRDEPFEAALISEIRAAFLTLPDRQRDATVLRHVLGLSSAEVAERLGCTPATVDVHVHRGVQAVRKQLAVKQLQRDMAERVEQARRRMRLKRLVTGAVAAVVGVLAWVAVTFNPARSRPNPDPSAPTPAPKGPWIHIGHLGGSGISSYILIALGALLVIFGVTAIVLLLRQRGDDDDE
jgi:RNA polymerase sigma factor (sigma-70 family)